MNTTKRILVIDDDPDILEIVRMVFVDAGFHVICWDVPETMDQILIAAPDLLLLDVRITGHQRDGMEICREIKAAAGAAPFRVILFSAEYDLSGIASSCGADGFIEKPFDLDDLLEKVGKFLS